MQINDNNNDLNDNNNDLNDNNYELNDNGNDLSINNNDLNHSNHFNKNENNAFIASEILYTQNTNEIYRETITETILIKAFNIEIRLQDTEPLTTNIAGKKWLNDNLIDFYFNMIKDAKINKYLTCDINILSSLEFNRFLNNKDLIKNDKKRYNIFHHDHILIPICHSDHWSLVNIHTKQKKVRYFDSCTTLNSNNERKILIKEFISYLIDQDSMKIGFSTKSSEWIFRAEAKLPQQTNSYDCGVFICFFAKIISYSYKILSNQLLDSHIIDFRKRMFEEIQKFELLDNDFNYATEFNLKKH